MVPTPPIGMYSTLHGHAHRDQHAGGGDLAGELGERVQPPPVVDQPDRHDEPTGDDDRGHARTSRRNPGSARAVATPAARRRRRRCTSPARPCAGSAARGRRVHAGRRRRPTGWRGRTQPVAKYVMIGRGEADSASSRSGTPAPRSDNASAPAQAPPLTTGKPYWTPLRAHVSRGYGQSGCVSERLGLDAEYRRDPARPRPDPPGVCAAPRPVRSTIVDAACLADVPASRYTSTRSPS